MVKNKAKSIILILACLTYFCSEQIEVDKVRNVDAAYWPVFRGDQNLSGVAEGTIPDNPELLWSFKTGSVIISSPVIGFGNIYIGSTDGKVYTIDLLTGKKVWEFDTEDDIEASPLIIDQTVYIGNLSGDFFALDAVAGKVVWKYKLDDGIMGSANRFAVPGSTE
ncbi:MAG: PQQ-binding-like beta-propeller repeat protein, partial [bacterium]|nr:PQQ-binding-like beta-propeller repeat protein [bacterium]